MVPEGVGRGQEKLLTKAAFQKEKRQWGRGWLGTKRRWLCPYHVSGSLNTRCLSHEKQGGSKKPLLFFVATELATGCQKPGTIKRGTHPWGSPVGSISHVEDPLFPPVSTLPFLWRPWTQRAAQLPCQLASDFFPPGTSWTLSSWGVTANRALWEGTVW